MIDRAARTLRLTDLISALLAQRDPDLWSGSGYVPVHSVAAGMSRVLSFLRSTKRLADKNTRILVPPGMQDELYNAIRPHGIPVLHDDPEIRALIIRHECGFPQDLEAVMQECTRRGIIPIEDCSQVTPGLVGAPSLGSRGLAGIFSSSHFHPSLVGGAVYSTDPALIEHLERLEKSASSGLALFSFGAKALRRRDGFGDSRNSLAERIDEMARAGEPYSRRLAWTERLFGTEEVRQELENRRRNYRLYREMLADNEGIQRLEPGVLPSSVPLMDPRREKLESALSALRRLGVETRISTFDVNRNVFRPRRIPCLHLPVHGGISEELIVRIAAVAKASR